MPGTFNFTIVFTASLAWWNQVRGQDRLDIGQVLFLLASSSQRVESHKLSLSKKERVSKGFIIWLSGNFLCGTWRVARRFPLGQPITAQHLIHLARSRSSPSIFFKSSSCFVGVVVRVIHLQGDGDSSKLASETAPLIEMAQAYGLRLWFD